MKLADFLIHLLLAHGYTLQRLAALLGEENLITVLENSGENHPVVPVPIKPTWLEPANAPAEGSPYMALEEAVHSMHLSPPLEFHLWAYPQYRAFIESPLDLNSRIRGPGADVGQQLVDEAIEQAHAWVRRLGIAEPMAGRAQQAAHVAWLRFRTDVLKRIGRRPMGPVY